MTEYGLKTPWTQALELPRSDEALERKLRVAPVAHPELKDLSPRKAGELLDKALKKLFHPSKQDLRIIRTLADIGWSHAAASYPSLDDFIRIAQIRPKVDMKLHKKEGESRVAAPDKELRLSTLDKELQRHAGDVRMTMLTGPAGVGKSSIRHAMERLFASEATVRASSGVPPFPIRPLAAFAMGEDLRTATRLNAIAESVGLEPAYLQGGAGDMSQF